MLDNTELRLEIEKIKNKLDNQDKYDSYEKVHQDIKLDDLLETGSP